LDVIDRLVRLYTNPGEIVFSPFTGIGSEGYVSLQRGRRFYGCELKPEYHAQALKNLASAQRKHAADSRTLFDAEAVA
jgi:DNA modification methylase